MKNILLSETLQSSLRKISLIASLKDNWDGNGALAFSTKMIEKVENIILSLAKQPEIFPTAANSIQLEFDGPDNSYLEIEIFKSRLAKVFVIDEDGKERCFNINDDIKTLNKLVISFYARKSKKLKK